MAQSNEAGASAERPVTRKERRSRKASTASSGGGPIRADSVQATPKAARPGPGLSLKCASKTDFFLVLLTLVFFLPPKSLALASGRRR